MRPAPQWSQDVPRDEPLRNAGIGLTVGGGVGAAVGFSMAFLGKQAVAIGGVAIASLGTLFFFSGIPMWIAGGTTIRSTDKPRSGGLIGAGSVIIGFGAGALISGSIFASAGAGTVAAPLLVSGVLTTSLGIGLVSWGADTVPATSASALPRVRIGVGAADLSWRF